MDIEVVCSACKSHLSGLSQPNSVIQEEFWPGSARRKSQYMFDQDLFLFFDLFQKNMPMFSCPPCSVHQHFVHVDGNKKLFHYAKVPRYIEQ